MRVCLDHTSLGSIISEMQPESLWTAGLRSRTSDRNSHSSRPAQVQEIARQIRRHDPQPPKHSGRESQAPTMDLQVQRRNWTRTPGRALSSRNMFLFRFWVFCILSWCFRAMYNSFLQISLFRAIHPMLFGLG